METINVLWTGGLDSTFRICELFRANAVIQPYYIKCHRYSESYEIRAIERISKKLKNSILKAQSDKIYGGGELKDTIFIDIESINPNEYITNAYNELHYRNGLGSQYEFLARFANQHNIRLEVGLEYSPIRGHATATILSDGNFITQRYSGLSSLEGEYLRAHPEKTVPTVNMIFGNFNIPYHLFQITKKQEVELLDKWGYHDIMLDTWFCHSPVFGVPCGRCSPCNDAMNMEMGWRVPIIGRLLGMCRAATHIPEVLIQKLKNL